MKANTVPKEAFINASELVFKDISSETDREYCFPNGTRLVIIKPLFLNVSASGGHRLFTEEGWCYYVQPKDGWWIRWRVKEGAPDFVR